MENGNTLQNEMGEQRGQVEQLQQTQQAQPSVDMGMDGGDVVMEPVKKSKKWLGWVLVGVVVVVAVVVVLVLVLGNSGGVTMDKVRAYCNNHGLEVSEGVLEENQKGSYIRCNTNYDKSAGAPVEDIVVMFAEYEKPLMEDEHYAKSYEFLKSVGIMLEETNEYKKIYMGNSEVVTGSETGVSYFVVGEKTSLSLVASSNELAKRAMIEMGYPDRNWGSDEDLKSTASELQMNQRDTKRREDVATVVSAITQYQANNRGQLPTGPSYWEGTAYIDCVQGQVACGFVQSYLNQTDDSEVNEFVDPVGEPYSLYITDNWVEKSEIMPIVFGEEDIELVADGDGYTVGGKDPFKERVIFVVEGGQCDGTKVVKATGERTFAVMHLLEGGDVYCVDNR